MGYKINRLNNDIIQILDNDNNCIYIVKGKERSLVIDLGMDKASIRPVIEYITDTPYDVICTHGHIDHVGRSGEFDNIHMSLSDKDVYLDNYKMNNPNDRFNILNLSLINYSKIKTIKNTYDLGDRVIHIIDCFGHTPGSIILLDKKNKTIFTGDAIGSGCGVWMQIDYALSIKDYYHSLKKCYSELLKYHVDDSWLFLGGHAYQEYQSKVSEFNKFDIYLLEDMITVCQLLLENKIEYHEEQTREFSTGKPYYACYGKAEIIFTLSQL